VVGGKNKSIGWSSIENPDFWFAGLRVFVAPRAGSVSDEPSRSESSSSKHGNPSLTLPALVFTGNQNTATSKV
jgi:hypothetical protein